MEAFINKMRKLKGIKKLILIEEAWKAIASANMADYIRYLYKTVRKYFGEAIVVTQKIEDIISSPIVKESIINNSDCKILLDQRKYLNKFDSIQNLLGLTDKERSQILSINMANHPGRKYKEVFFSLGGTQSAVYATEVSLEEYFTFTTEESEKGKASAVDDQVALMEKSYELAAKYMNDGGQNGQTAQVPVAGTVTQKPQAQPVQAIRETTVSGLQQPMSDADFIRAYSQPRNYGFNTAVGTGYAMGKNTVAACIHQDQTLMDGQAVKLRLLEPVQAGNIVVPKNTLVAGTAKVQGERLDILVSSIEYAGNIIPVELAVFDTDGQKGLSVPSSMEQEAFNEAMANIGSGLGTSISFARSAGQQVAMDVTRGLLQGTSGYLAKKFRTVKVKLKAGYKVMLYAKQQ